MAPIEDILNATGGILICGDENKKISSVSTDSRTLDGDTLFVPLKGERFDGHDFTGNAPMYITHKDEQAVEGKTIVRVDNTLTAFGKIAKYYKEKHPVLTVGVVGSVGKTTTSRKTTSPSRIRASVRAGISARTVPSAPPCSLQPPRLLTSCSRKS